MDASSTSRDRPILFSGPMLRAILDGRKTVTRRVVKPPRWSQGEIDEIDDDGFPLIVCKHTGCLARIESPYGAPGDRLWVRETWAQPVYHTRPGRERRPRDVVYRADVGKENFDFGGNWALQDGDCTWKPGIHMPRWASRLRLEVVSVRVERLQEITEEDARAEGYEPSSFYDELAKNERASRMDRLSGYVERPAQTWFRKGWDTINGKRAPWASNPWVWRVEFIRL